MIIYRIKNTPHNIPLVYEDIDIAMREVKFLLEGNVKARIIIETDEMDLDDYEDLPRFAGC